MTKFTFVSQASQKKGTIATESKAAVAGGITTYMEMPNVNPPTTTLDALEEKYQRASQSSHANYAFYLGATNDNIDEIRRLDPNAACGVKVFMGASTGNMLVNDPDTLDAIFADCPTLIATHCEDTPMINELESIYREKYGDDVPIDAHAHIRSKEACLKIVTAGGEFGQKTRDALTCIAPDHRRRTVPV